MFGVETTLRLIVNDGRPLIRRSVTTHDINLKHKRLLLSDPYLDTSYQPEFYVFHKHQHLRHDIYSRNPSQLHVFQSNTLYTCII